MLLKAMPYIGVNGDHFLLFLLLQAGRIPRLRSIHWITARLPAPACFLVKYEPATSQQLGSRLGNEAAGSLSMGHCPGSLNSR